MLIICIIYIANTVYRTRLEKNMKDKFENTEIWKKRYVNETVMIFMKSIETFLEVNF